MRTISACRNRGVGKQVFHGRTKHARDPPSSFSWFLQKPEIKQTVRPVSVPRMCIATRYLVCCAFLSFLAVCLFRRGTPAHFVARMHARRRYLDLLAHYQVKRWLAGQTPLDGSVVMAQVEAGDGAVQTANRVRKGRDWDWSARKGGGEE